MLDGSVYLDVIFKCVSKGIAQSPEGLSAPQRGLLKRSKISFALYGYCLATEEVLG